VKPSNLTLIQIILSAGVTIALGGMAYGSLASDQITAHSPAIKNRYLKKLIKIR
jgi:hypothetical protein